MSKSDRFLIYGKALTYSAVRVGKTLADSAGRMGDSLTVYHGIGEALEASRLRPVPPAELDLPPALLLPARGRGALLAAEGIDVPGVLSFTAEKSLVSGELYRRRSLGRQRRRRKKSRPSGR